MKKSIIGAAMCVLMLAGSSEAAMAASALPGVDLDQVYITPDARLSGEVFLLDNEGNETPVSIGDDGTVKTSPEPRGCAWYNMAIPVGGGWYTSVDGCSLIGTTNGAQHTYEFAVDPNSHSNACVTGRGYKKVGTSWQPQYQGIGCGSSGAGTVTIGNVATVGKVQAQSIGSTGSAIKWK